MNTYKNMRNIEVGDVIIHSKSGRTPEVARVTEVKAAILRAEPFAFLDNVSYRKSEVTVMRASGKERGSSSRYWSFCGDLDLLREAHQQELARRAARDDRARAQVEARREAVRKANPTLKIVDTGILGVQAVEYVDGAGRENALFFFSKPGTRYAYGLDSPNQGFDIVIAEFGPAHDNRFYGRSEWGKTVEEALYTVIEHTFPL